MDSPYLPVGSVLRGRYEILREIGRGGYSVVYAARDRGLETEVAVKLLVPSPASAQVARERMRREVRVVRGLSHPNIVAVHDFLEEGPWSFIVMELVRGPDLSVRLHDRGPLMVDEAVSLGLDMAAALSAAHKRGILHRDVKPQNILLDPEGRARLTDFGSARHDGQVTVTQTGAFVGTLAYAAPEALAGHRGDARADLYALGMTLYFALANRLPDRPSPHLPPSPAAGGHHLRALRPELPGWLDDVIARATAAEPRDRFHAASSLGDALTARGAGVRLSVGRRKAAQEFCLLCGEPEPLGLSVCTRCGGNAPGVADTLVFVRPPDGQAHREDLRDRLAEWLDRATQDGGLKEAAGGRRALVQIPAASGEKVVRQLALNEVPAHTVPAGYAWGAVPQSLYRMMGLMALAGGAVAFTTSTAFFLSTPILIGSMLLVAHRVVQRPLQGASRRRKAILEPELERKVVDFMSKLPAGSARDLLGDVVRMGQALLPRVAQATGQAVTAAQVTSLLSLACDAAGDLADLDENLARFDRQRERLTAPPAAWLDGLAECERARDRLVQSLLEVTTALSKAQSLSALAAAAEHEPLAELTRELEAQIQARAEAAVQVEELLAASR